MQFIITLCGLVSVDDKFAQTFKTKHDVFVIKKPNLKRSAKFV